MDTEHEVNMRLFQFHLSGFLEVPRYIEELETDFHIETWAFRLPDGRRVRPVLAFVVDGDPTGDLLKPDDVGLHVNDYSDACLEPFS
jgi:hypothetical protein